MNFSNFLTVCSKIIKFVKTPAIRQILQITLFTCLIFVAILEILLHHYFSPVIKKNELSFEMNCSGWLVVDPNIEPDSIRGMRFYENGKAHYYYFADTCCEIDFKMHVNNRGYASKTDYHFKKKTAKRYLVFGDSFSAGLIMDTTWVDYVNLLCVENNLPVELYNFSIDGGGMANWCNIYKHEIDTAYEFDGIILAPYIDNLNRLFITWWYDADCIKAAYLPTPKDFDRKNEFASCAYQHYTEDSFAHYKHDYMERCRQQQAEPFILTPSFLSGSLIWGDPYERGQKKYYNQYIEDGAPLAFEALKQRYNPANLSCLDSMVKSIHEKKAELLIAVIPDLYVVQRKINEPSFKALYEQDLEKVAEHYSARLFNGNNAFALLHTESLRKLWLKGDLYWNQAGAKFFAQKYYIYLLELYYADKKAATVDQ